MLGKFESLGFAVAGVSKDTVASHVKFADKLGLTYPLLSDTGTGFLAALGAFGEKKSRGKVIMGITRTSYVFDAKGKLTRLYTKVKAKGHARAVLEDLGG